MRRLTWNEALDGLVGAAFVASAVWALTAESGGAASWVWAAVAATGVGVVFAIPVALVAGRREHLMLLETPVLLPVVMLLAPPAAFVATVVGAGVGTAVRVRDRRGRGAGVAVARTVAIFGTSAAALAAAAPHVPQAGASLLVGVLLLQGLHLLVVLSDPLLRQRANPETPDHSVFDQLRLPLLVAPLAALAGGTVVLLVRHLGAPGLAALAPVALVLLVGARLTSTQQDRRRLEALYTLATTASTASSRSEAFAAARDAADQVVAGVTISVDATPGTAEELSLPLDESGWLVVGHHADPPTTQDVEVLTAVAQLASTAAERAELIGQLHRQERVKTTLLAAVGHDLQTPLAIQIGVADTLLHHGDSLSDDEVRQLLERVRVQAGAMSRTVRDLVDLKRLELQEASGPAADLVEVVRSWSAQHPGVAEGHTLELDVPDDEVLITLDPAYVERIIDNLVANAVRHSDPTDPVTIRVARDGTEALLAVEDRGAGVGDADKERIFGAFDQGGGEVRGAAGLGLFIVSRFVEHGGGRVAVDDRRGGGASFQVRLPLRSATTQS